MWGLVVQEAGVVNAYSSAVGVGDVQSAAVTIVHDVPHKGRVLYENATVRHTNSLAGVVCEAAAKDAGQSVGGLTISSDGHGCLLCIVTAAVDALEGDVGAIDCNDVVESPGINALQLCTTKCDIASGERQQAVISWSW